MGLLCQLPKQIPSHFSKRTCCAKAKGTKIDQGKSTIYRCNIWFSNYQNIRWKHLQYNAVKSEIYAQCSNAIYSQ